MRITSLFAILLCTTLSACGGCNRPSDQRLARAVLNYWAGQYNGHSGLRYGDVRILGVTTNDKCTAGTFEYEAYTSSLNVNTGGWSSMAPNGTTQTGALRGADNGNWFATVTWGMGGVATFEVP